MNEKLVTILSRIFDVKSSEIHESLQQQDIAKWDSLTHMDLISAIEYEYQLELTMEDILKMTSVNGIITILKNYGINPHA